MGLLTRPTDLTPAERVVYTIINTIYELYDILGTSINGRGSLNYLNLSATANLEATQIADSAWTLNNSASPGEQIAVKPTKISGRVQFKEADLSGWSFDEDDTLAVALGGATTFALTPGKGAYVLTDVSGVTLATITGGQEGDVIYLLIKDVNVTLDHQAGAVADTFWLIDEGDRAGQVGGAVTRLRYSAWTGTGRWYEG